jgi:hypothetical protein
MSRLTKAALEKVASRQRRDSRKTMAGYASLSSMALDRAQAASLENLALIAAVRLRIADREFK